MEKAWTSTTFYNDDEPALSAELLNAKDSAADEIDNRVVELGNKLPFSLGIDENGNCGYIKPGEDKVTLFGSGGSPGAPLKVIGLTSEITVEPVTE